MEFFNMKKMEEKITKAMKKAFSSTKNRKRAIHVTALAGAGIVAILPIGSDVVGLRVAEVTMVICIAGSYGEKLTKSAAKGLMLSSFAQLAGEAAAITALEAAEASKIASAATGVGPLIAYGIKSSIAVSLIETVGHLVMNYYEKPGGLGAKVCKTTEKIGAVADISRATEFVAHSLQSTEVASEQLFDNNQEAKEISFLGKIYTVDDLADAAKKIDQAKAKVKQYEEYLASDIRFGRDTALNRKNLEFAIKALKAAQKNYDFIRSRV